MPAQGRREFGRQAEPARFPQRRGLSGIGNSLLNRLGVGSLTLGAPTRPQASAPAGELAGSRGIVAALDTAR